VLRDTTSRGLYVRVWPPHTLVFGTSLSERRGGGGGCHGEQEVLNYTPSKNDTGPRLYRRVSGSTRNCTGCSTVFCTVPGYRIKYPPLVAGRGKFPSTQETMTVKPRLAAALVLAVVLRGAAAGKSLHGPVQAASAAPHRFSRPQHPPPSACAVLAQVPSGPSPHRQRIAGRSDAQRAAAPESANQVMRGGTPRCTLRLVSTACV
jgi:hypothetical protein